MCLSGEMSRVLVHYFILFISVVIANLLYSLVGAWTLIFFSFAFILIIAASLLKTSMPLLNLASLFLLSFWGLGYIFVW